MRFNPSLVAIKSIKDIREAVKIKIIGYFSLSSHGTLLNEARYGFAEIYYPPRESKKNRGKRQKPGTEQNQQYW